MKWIVQSKGKSAELNEAIVNLFRALLTCSAVNPSRFMKFG